MFRIRQRLKDNIYFIEEYRKTWYSLFILSRWTKVEKEVEFNFLPDAQDYCKKLMRKRLKKDPNTSVTVDFYDNYDV